MNYDGKAVMGGNGMRSVKENDQDEAGWIKQQVDANLIRISKWVIYDFKNWVSEYSRVNVPIEVDESGRHDDEMKNECTAAKRRAEWRST